MHFKISELLHGRSALLIDNAINICKASLTLNIAIIPVKKIALQAAVNNFFWRLWNGVRKPFISFLILSANAAYMSTPCHIELILAEKEAPVKAEVNFFHLSSLKRKQQ